MALHASYLTKYPHYKKRFVSENTEKAGHNVKPRLPGKMCTLRSQHAIGQSRLQRKTLKDLYTTYTIRPSGVFIQRTGFVFYRTL